MPALTRAEDLADLLGIPLSDEQLAAACAPLEPGIIAAGAGTGKTTVMAARVVWLIGTGQVGPGQVLGLTFTRKAAGELAERIRGALVGAGLLDADDLDSGEPTVATYDAFAGALVHDHGVRIGIEPGRRLMVDAQRYQLACRVVADPACAIEHLAHLAVGTVAQRLLRLDGQLTSHLVGIEQARQATLQFLADADAAPLWRGSPYKPVVQAAHIAQQRLELLDLVQAYHDLKADLGLWEFADQMQAAVALATQAPAVGQQLRARYHIVLLDEYQDTSHAQIRLLTGLFSGPDPASGRGHPVTAVGDASQAIYAWRGAASDTLNRFVDTFPRADDSAAGGYRLTINRRSGRHILDVANAVAQPLREESDAAAMLVPAPDRAPGQVRAAVLPTFPDEVGWVCDQVMAAHDRLGVAWSDIAVLTRRNVDIGTFHDRLVALDVPVEVVGLGGLLSLPEVGQIVATLRLLVDVRHNPSVLTLLAGPRWRLGAPDLERLGARALGLARQQSDADGQPAPEPDVCLLDAVADPGPGPYDPGVRAELSAFVAELHRLRAHRDDPLGHLVLLVVDTIGLRAEIAARPGQWSRSAAEQVDQFIRAVAGFQDAAGQTTLSGLLAWLDAEREAGEELGQAVVSADDSVKLLTVHAAKGLEWDVVALPCLGKGVFPNDRGGDNWARQAESLPAPLRGDADSVPQLAQVTKDGLAEYAEALTVVAARGEDRLAYVAASRARELLIGSASWWRPGRVTPGAPSRVFDALAECAAEQGWRVERAPAPEADEPNPLGARPVWVPWQDPAPDAELLSWAAAQVGETAAPDEAGLGQSALTRAELSAEDAAAVRVWTEQLRRQATLERERRRGGGVRVPRSLSVTQLVRTRTDPGGLAADLERPMPRVTSSQAGLGTRFHDWVRERFALPAQLDESLELPGLDAEPDEVAADDELAQLQERFLVGPYASRQPLAVEIPYVLSLAGRELRGRIDAVYRGDGHPYRYQVVDWKTSPRQTSDPLQLAVYRLAWALAHGCDPDEVDAVFYYVRGGDVRRPERLPGRTDIEAMLARLAASGLGG